MENYLLPMVGLFMITIIGLVILSLFRIIQPKELVSIIALIMAFATIVVSFFMLPWYASVILGIVITISLTYMISSILGVQTIIKHVY